MIDASQGRIQLGSIETSLQKTSAMDRPSQSDGSSSGADLADLVGQGPAQKISTEDRRTAASIKPEPIDWEPQYTEGPSRIVSQFDGTKDCLALLLTEEVVQNIKEINRQTELLEGRRGWWMLLKQEL